MTDSEKREIEAAKAAKKEKERIEEEAARRISDARLSGMKLFASLFGWRL